MLFYDPFYVIMSMRHAVCDNFIKLLIKILVFLSQYLLVYLFMMNDLSLSYLDYKNCSKNNYDVYYQEKYNDKRETEFSAPETASTGIFIIMKNQRNMLSLLNKNNL